MTTTTAELQRQYGNSVKQIKDATKQKHAHTFTQDGGRRKEKKTFKHL